MQEPAGPPVKRRPQVVSSWTDGEYSRSPVGAMGMTFFMDPPAPGAGGPCVFIVKFPPNYQVPPHKHGSDYFSVVLEGEVTVTGKRFTVGHVRFIRESAGYGPLTYGPQGCTVLEVFASVDGVPAQPLRESDRPRFIEISEELRFSTERLEG